MTYNLGATAVGMAIALAGTALPAAAQTIYSNDFSSGTAGFSGATTIATTPSGENYLQLYNGGSDPATGQATLSIAPGSSNLNLSFDAYAINTTDGNGPYGGGADPFQILINGTLAYDVNFANYGGNTQSYSGDLATSGPGFSYAPQTGATAIGTLGYGSSNDSTYHLSFSLPDLATSVTFIGATNQSLGDENYGIDNVVLTGTLAGTPVASATPEPASWAMMIIGFGLIGAGMRYRRRRTVLHYA